MEEEHHHHLVFENSYVKAFFVEIPAHESTLYHRHDLPYVNLPPGGADAVSLPPGSGAQQGVRGPKASFSPGGFSHAVNNSGDTPLRNVAIELLRPQGTIRNRCIMVVRDQAMELCHAPILSVAIPWHHSPLFETDEILVESWELAPNVTTKPWHDRLDMLVGGLTGVSITADSGLDSASALKGGPLWIPAGSKPVFKTGPDSGGHFVVITFKDGKPPRH